MQEIFGQMVENAFLSFSHISYSQTKAARSQPKQKREAGHDVPAGASSGAASPQPVASSGRAAAFRIRWSFRVEHKLSFRS
jgi:hypothetical protein